MDTNKFAWRLLHARVRDHYAANEGLAIDDSPVVTTTMAILREIDDAGVNKDNVLVALAGWGNWFANALRTSPEAPLHVAADMERAVMALFDE